VWTEASWLLPSYQCNDQSSTCPPRIASLVGATLFRHGTFTRGTMDKHAAVRLGVAVVPTRALERRRATAASRADQSKAASRSIRGHRRRGSHRQPVPGQNTRCLVMLRYSRKKGHGFRWVVMALMLVGRTGFEPVTSSASGMTTRVLNWSAGAMPGCKPQLCGWISLTEAACGWQLAPRPRGGGVRSGRSRAMRISSILLITHDKRRVPDAAILHRIVAGPIQSTGRAESYPL
jgi:hypothetical protein